MSAAKIVSSRPRNHISALEQLHQLNLTSANPAFDRLTQLAARALKVPQVLVSVLDEERQWFIGSFGLPDLMRASGSIPLSSSLCYHVQEQQQPLIIRDMRQGDYRSASAMMIELGGVAYAGVPLTDADGAIFGVLCALDTQPRDWTPDEIEILRALAQSIMTEAELSLKLIENEQVKAELARERDLLRALIDSSPDYIFIKDAEGRFVISNRAHAEAAQTSDADLLVGKTAFDTFPPDLAEQYDSDDRAVLQSGEPLLNLERQTVDANGNLRWVLTTKVPFTSRNGSMRGIVGISRDITDRKLAEMALREREHFIEQTLMTNPAIVYVYDLVNQRNIYSNVEIAHVLGYSPAEIAEMGSELFTRLMHPEDLLQQEDRIRCLFEIADGEVIEHEYRMRHRSGEYRWLFSRDMIFQRDAAGKPIQVIGAALDITERKQAEAALRESQHRLRAILDHAPVLLFELDERGYFTLAEGKGLRSIGVEPGTVTGASALAVFAGSPQITARLERALAGEKVDFILDHGDIVLQMSFTPSLDEHNRVRSVIGVGNDVTEQMRSRDQAASSNAHLTLLREIDAQLTESLQLDRVLSAALSAALDISGASDAYIALLEDDTLTITEAAGRYKRGTTLPANSGGLRQVIDSQRSRLWVIDGDMQPVGAVPPGIRAQKTIPLIYGDRAIGILHLDSKREDTFDDDVNAFLASLALRAAVAVENARLYSLSQSQLITLQELYDKVRALEQIKTDMIRIAAHDLRNPLTGAHGYLTMLSEMLSERATDKEREYLEMLGDALRKMQKIIGDILSLQRIEVMNERANYEAVNLRALVLALIDANSPSAAAKQIAFKCEIPRKAIIVRADSAQLREAIDNLINNAIKYTPEGGQVTVVLKPDAERVTLDVIDTGFGIPEAVQGRIFQPFFRAKTPQTRQIEGTGLGLHLVKNIVERHAGKMHFESAPGRGSTFGFCLPIMQDQEKPPARGRKRTD